MAARPTLANLNERQRQGYVELEAFSLARLPFVDEDADYEFIVDGNAKILVKDQNFEQPQRLANWLFQLEPFAYAEHDPADVTELTLEVQRQLTTEQGDFTTLMILAEGVRKREAKNA